VSFGSDDEGGCGFDCAVFCGTTACDTADAEETGLIIIGIGLDSCFMYRPIWKKVELMNILSSRGFSEVISRSYKHDGRAIPGLSARRRNERIVMNESQWQASHSGR
jgi:hypothetical protein